LNTAPNNITAIKAIKMIAFRCTWQSNAWKYHRN